MTNSTAAALSLAATTAHSVWMTAKLTDNSAIIGAAENAWINANAVRRQVADDATAARLVYRTWGTEVLTALEAVATAAERYNLGELEDLAITAHRLYATAEARLDADYAA